MAVVPMQKVRLVTYAQDADAVLEIIQRYSAVEFKAVENNDNLESSLDFPYSELLPKIQHAVVFMETYAPEKKLWQTLREGTRTALTESELAKLKENADAWEMIVTDLEKLQVEFADLDEKIRRLQEDYDLLKDWQGLAIPLSKLTTAKTETILVKGHALGEEDYSSRINALLKKKKIAHLLTIVNEVNLAVTISKGGDKVKAIQILEDDNFEIINLPEGKETVDIEFVKTMEELTAAKNEKALLIDQAEHFAITHLQKLQVASEILSWHQDRYELAELALPTKYTLQFEGWLNANKRKQVEADIKDSNLAAIFTELQWKEGEEPPVEIENSALFRPFEAVTRLYGMPGYHDLDPTPFLAAFFFLFFGLSLTDVGYGLALIVSAIAILTLFKVSESTKLFAKLLLFVGTATVIVGALFGGYFGIPPDQLPALLRKFQMFDPIGNPLPVFYLALGLGVVQVMTGMVVKIYSEYKQGRFINGVIDQGPWLFLFLVGILYIATMVGYVSLITTEQIVDLAYLGVAMIVLSAARHGENILIRIKNAVASLYDSIGYFSDILSYSRLLALGLATTALAFAVNLIASMVFDKNSYITYLFAGAVLLIGHLFTLAVNTLGAFIHSARLQFVEFFGKFIEGTGKEFAPLARSDDHVTIVDD